MSAATLELRPMQGITPAASVIEVHVGEAITSEFSHGEVRSFAAQVHGALGEYPQFMYQPPFDTILTGINRGNFVLAVNDAGIVVATSHIREASNGDKQKRELGGVLGGNGQGRVVVEEGVQLAFRDERVRVVEALVANANQGGQAFFKKLGEPVRERPSDYVKDKAGIPRMMTVFDLSALGKP